METLIAHRGSHERAPENTLAAFGAAASHGAEMVEFDVRRTADGQLAIFHDPEVSRTALSRLTLAELRVRTGIDVPVLADVLAWAQTAGMGVDVELKEDGYVAEVAELVRGFDGPVLVTSFIDPVLAQMAELAPEIERGLLLEWTALGALKRVEQCGADGAVIKMNLLKDDRLLRDLAGAGHRVHLWGFDPTRHRDWLEHRLVAGVITDDVLGTRRAALVRV